MFDMFKKHQNSGRPNSKQAENKIKEKIIEELLRQARLTFNQALGVTAASAIITLSGVGLFYLNKASEASLTAGTGILANISCVLFAERKKEELREMLEELEE